MSGKAMGRGWELDLPPNEKYVLLAMLDHADHEGRNMYPGHRLIAWKTDYHEDTVIRLVASLEAKGVLVREQPGRRPSRANPYHINWEACEYKPKYERGSLGRPGFQKVTDRLQGTLRKVSGISSGTLRKQTDIHEESNRHWAEKKPTLEGNHPTSSRVGDALNHLTIKEPLKNLAPNGAAHVSFSSAPQEENRPTLPAAPLLQPRCKFEGCSEPVAKTPHVARYCTEHGEPRTGYLQLAQAYKHEWGAR